MCCFPSDWRLLSGGALFYHVSLPLSSLKILVVQSDSSTCLPPVPSVLAPGTSEHFTPLAPACQIANSTFSLLFLRFSSTRYLLSVPGTSRQFTSPFPTCQIAKRLNTFKFFYKQALGSRLTDPLCAFRWLNPCTIIAGIDLREFSPKEEDLS